MSETGDRKIVRRKGLLELYWLSGGNYHRVTGTHIRELCEVIIKYAKRLAAVAALALLAVSPARAEDELDPDTGVRRFYSCRVFYGHGGLREIVFYALGQKVAHVKKSEAPQVIIPGSQYDPDSNLRVIYVMADENEISRLLESIAATGCRGELFGNEDSGYWYVSTTGYGR